MRTPELKEKWGYLVKNLSHTYADGEEMDLDGILFLIGVRELGQGYRKFKKDEKLNVLHIAICKILSYYGYYKLSHLDEEGWPHYELTENLPNLTAGQQSLIMKEGIVQYFEEENLMEFTGSQGFEGRI